MLEKESLYKGSDNGSLIGYQNRITLAHIACDARSTGQGMAGRHRCYDMLLEQRIKSEAYHVFWCGQASDDQIKMPIPQLIQQNLIFPGPDRQTVRETRCPKLGNGLRNKRRGDRRQCSDPQSRTVVAVLRKHPQTIAGL
ncbi:hypothetical protein KIN_02910 [Litoreibacter roseus]|uniref:Uncharacterized protein n=1 Tax=Litoreibacter roseus TaxID=2601869 RepID=A0A6N6JB49_9RHOB|nr:hypothetical protein KIN_02910 [Litoreibacter roseus]